MKLARLLAFVLLAELALGGAVQAGSTVNPAVPAQNSPLSSAVVRNNFAATYNDINNILGKFQGSSAPLGPTTFQDWANTSGGSTVTFNLWNPTTNSWVTWGSLNVNTGVFATTACSGCALLSAANTFTASPQTVQGLTTTQPGWYVQLTGDSVARVRIGLNSTDVASIGFGSGVGARDTFIERIGAGSLRINASLTIGTNIALPTGLPFGVNLNTGAIPLLALAGEQFLAMFQAADGNVTGVSAVSYGSFAGFNVTSAGGTNAIPTPLTQGQLVGVFDAHGLYAATGCSGPCWSAAFSSFRFIAYPTGGTWSATNQGGGAQITAVPPGVATLGNNKTVATFYADSTSAVSLNVGSVGSVNGVITQAGNIGGIVSLVPQNSFTSYNLNWPSTPGSATFLLTSQGGVSGVAMTWTSPTITINGTSCTLGGSCSPGAGAIAVGDSVTGGTPNGVFFNSANALGNTAAGTNGQVLVGVTSGNPLFVSMSLDATISNAGVLTLATSGVTAGTYGGTTNAVSITFDAKGRATAASSVTLNPTQVNGVSFGAAPIATNAVCVSTSSTACAWGSVPNLALANSNVTIGSTNVALGATAATIAGLTLTAPVIGAATGTSLLLASPVVTAGTSFAVFGQNTSTLISAVINGNAAAPPVHPPASNSNENIYFQIALADATPGGMTIDVFGTGNTTAFGVYDCRRTNGTNASPIPLAAGDLVCVIGSLGQESTTPGDYSKGFAQLRSYANPSGSNFTTSDNGGYWAALSTPPGSPALGNLKQVAAFIASSTTAVGVNIGTPGSLVGSVILANATSGTESITPATGALGNGVASLPAGTYNIVGDSLTQTLTNKTIGAATISGTISGGGNNLNNIIIGATTPLAGSFTTLIASTSITSPIHYGNTTAAGTLTLASTSGAGTTDSIVFQTGSQVQRGTIATGGQWIIGANGISSGGSGTPLFDINANSAAVNYPAANTPMLRVLNANASPTIIAFQNYGSQNQFFAIQSGGTATSPTATGAGSAAFNIVGSFYNGTGYGPGNTSTGTTANVSIQLLALNAQTTLDGSSQIIFKTVPSGSTTLATVMTLQSGMQIGAPTGGDKGAGTINPAGAYYANGTKGVTCSGALTVISSIAITNGIITAATGTGGTCS